MARTTNVEGGHWRLLYWVLLLLLLVEEATEQTAALGADGPVHDDVDHHGETYVLQKKEHLLCDTEASDSEGYRALGSRGSWR